MGSPASRKAAFEMGAGDLVLCWQSDRRAAVGLAEVVDDPADVAEAGGVVDRQINLKPIKHFDPEVKLLDLRKSNRELAAVKAFRSGPIQSIYRTSPSEAAAILSACRVAAATAASTPRGGDAAARKRVEIAAVSHVTGHYEANGWAVRSVEAENLGHDLVARRGRRELHLEVKGLAGPVPRFNLTANEYRAAQTDSRFKLCLVTSATTPSHRTLHEWSGSDLIATGQFSVVTYVVQMELP
jgi:hypothetical protein